MKRENREAVERQVEIERTVADRLLDKEGPREPPGWPEGTTKRFRSLCYLANATTADYV